MVVVVMVVDGGCWRRRRRRRRCLVEVGGVFECCPLPVVAPPPALLWNLLVGHGLLLRALGASKVVGGARKEDQSDAQLVREPDEGEWGLRVRRHKKLKNRFYDSTM